MAIQKMKVLMVATAYPRYPGDVITPWLTTLVRKLKDRSVDVRVFTSSYKGIKSQRLDDTDIYRFRYAPAFIENLTHDKTAIDRVKENPLYILLAILYLIFGSMALVRLLRKMKFDVVHIHWPIPHIIFGIVGRMVRRFKLVSSFHGVEIRWLKRDLPLFFPLFRQMLDKSDIITANSNHTKNELLPDFKAEVIPFGTGFRPVKDIKEGDYILFAGRLVERKGVAYLIKAYAQIKDKITEHLVIVGSGPEMPGLKALTLELEIGDKVDFLGFVSDNKLAELLSGCRIFCLPAIVDKKGDTEGLGVVLIEALANRKPVIASNTGGITDVIIDNKTGILVPPADPDSLAQAILELIKDQELRKKLGKEGEQYVRRNFSWSRIVDRIIEIYR